MYSCLYKFNLVEKPGDLSFLQMFAKTNNTISVSVGIKTSKKDDAGATCSKCWKRIISLLESLYIN